MKKLDIFNEIGEGGLTARAFIGQLKALDVRPEDELEICINSPGGSVFDGIAIYNAILELSAKKKTCRVMGWAASMASVIAMAFDEIVMGDGAFMMIHNPWTLSIGDAEQLRKDASLLESIKSQIMGAYKRHSGLDEAEISRLMDETTWMTADEAIFNGFAHSKFEGLPIAASITGSIPATFAKMPDTAKAWIKEEAQNASNEPAPKGKPAEAAPEVLPSVPCTKCEDLKNIVAETEKRHVEYLAKLTSAKDEQIAALNASAKAKDDKMASLNESLNKKQSDCDRLRENIAELSARLEQLLMKGCTLEPEIDDWKQALAKCDGDYVKARRSYPQLFSKYMSKITR